MDAHAIGFKTTPRSAEQDVAKLLRVGMPVILVASTIEDPQGVFPGRILGWSKDRFLLIEPQSPTYHSRAFNTTRPTLLRFLVEGQVCGAQVRILSGRLTAQDLALKVSWPTDFQCAVLRRERRVNFDLPCTVSVEGGPPLPATLRDLSRSGCAVLVGVALKAGAHIACSFRLPSGAAFNNIECEIRHVETEDDGCNAGCSFKQLDAMQVQRIEFAVDSKLIMAGNADLEAPRFVVLAEPSPGLEDLHQRLKERNIALRVAHDPLHALAWLASSPATALFVQSKNADLHPNDLCRIVKGAGPGTVPIYIVGADAKSSDFPDAAGTLRSLQEMVPVIDGLVARMQARRAADVAAGIQIQSATAE